MKLDEKRSDKRKRILDAAAALVSERGLHDTPMSLLARRAGLSAGTIYRYFRNKDQMLNALYEEINARIHRTMLDGYDPAAPVRVRFNIICGNLLRFYMDNPQAHKFIGQYIYTPHIAEETYARIFSESLAPLAEFFTDMMRRGILKNIPMAMVFSFIHGPVDTLIRQHQAGRIKITKNVAARIADICWDALRETTRHRTGNTGRGTHGR